MLVDNSKSLVSRSLYKMYNDTVIITNIFNKKFENDNKTINKNDNYYYYSFKKNEISNIPIGDDYIAINLLFNFVDTKEELLQFVISYYENELSKYLLDPLFINSYDLLLNVINREVPFDVIEGYSLLKSVCSVIGIDSDSEVNEKVKKFIESFDYDLYINLIQIYFSAYDDIKSISRYIQIDFLDLLFTNALIDPNTSSFEIQEEAFVDLDELNMINSIYAIASHKDVNSEFLIKVLQEYPLSVQSRQIILKERLLKKYGPIG